jgi:pimeloyl-ACP methyl ester carboxylesterase
MKRTRRFLTVAIIVALVYGGSAFYGQDEVAARPSIAESRDAKLDGHRVHYESFGSGSDAVFLIHGWTGDLGLWRGQIPDLSKRSRVIAIDLPGHGKSDKPQVSYSMDYFARAVDAVMQDAGVRRAVLVGHSMGTPVARQFYRKYPQKTLGIVIVDGALRPFGDKKMVDTFIAPLRGPNYKEQATQMINGMMGPEVPAAVREQVKASTLGTPQHVAVSAMEGMVEESIWTNDKIEVPVLAVLAKSPFWPADNEQFFRSLVPNLDYQMWAGVSHFLMMEKPKEFTAAVIAFLDKQQLLKN